MIWRWPDPLAKANVGNEAQVAVRYAERSFLGLQKKLLHGHQISRHLTADFTSLQTSFRPLATRRIRGLSHAHDARPNPVLPSSAAANQEIRAN